MWDFASIPRDERSQIDTDQNSSSYWLSKQTLQTPFWALPLSMKSQTHSNFEGRCFKNHWHPSFSVHNDNIGGDDQSAPDAQRAAGVVLDDTMAIFLERDASPLVSPDIEDVQRYCEGANDENVESGVGDAGALRNAWLDQRNSPYLNGSGNAREHENPLTATGLFRQLKRPVWKHP